MQTLEKKRPSQSRAMTQGKKSNQRKFGGEGGHQQGLRSPAKKGNIRGLLNKPAPRTWEISPKRIRGKVAGTLTAVQWKSTLSNGRGGERYAAH